MNLRRDTRATRPRPIAAYPAKRVGFPRVAQRRRKVATFRRRIARQQSRKVSGAPAARSRDNEPSARSHGSAGPNGDAARTDPGGDATAQSGRAGGGDRGGP